MPEARVSSQVPDLSERPLGSWIADCLEANQPAILEAWTAAVRSDPLIQSDESITYAEFIDHIPNVIREICNVLRGSSLRREEPQVRKDASLHGLFRWQQGYDLPELTREIGHMRRVLVDFLARAVNEAGHTYSERPEVLNTVLRVVDEGQVVTIARYQEERDRQLAERDEALQRRDFQLAERDRELQRSLLDQERMRVEALETAGRAKDQFLAVLSHELRTPLTPILAWISILEKDPRAANVTAGLEAIRRNTRVLARLIDDLLDVSRIVSGKLEYVDAVLDARDVVRGAVETVQPAAAERRVTLRVETPPEPLPALGDATRLQQVVWNLLSNAVKFSRQGGEVRVAAAADGDEVVIAVTDAGMGIRRDFLPHVFDTFRQQDQKSTRDHEGLGLGLAIARAITEAHGGRLTASSEGAGRGSRFELRLSRYDADAEAGPKHASLEGAAATRVRPAPAVDTSIP